jgi:hypothetical protein
MSAETGTSLKSKLVVTAFLFVIVLYFAPAVAIGLLAAVGLALRTLLQVFFGAM